MKIRAFAVALALGFAIGGSGDVAFADGPRYHSQAAPKSILKKPGVRTPKKHVRINTARRGPGAGYGNVSRAPKSGGRHVRFRLPNHGPKVGSLAKPNNRKASRVVKPRPTTSSALSGPKNRPHVRSKTNRYPYSSRTTTRKPAHVRSGAPRSTKASALSGHKNRPHVRSKTNKVPYSSRTTSRKPAHLRSAKPSHRSATKARSHTKSAKHAHKANKARKHAKNANKARKTFKTGRTLAKVATGGAASMAVGAALGVKVPDAVDAATWSYNTLKNPKQAPKRFAKLGKDTVKTTAKAAKTLTQPKTMARNLGNAGKKVGKGVTKGACSVGNLFSKKRKKC